MCASTVTLINRYFCLVKLTSHRDQHYRLARNIRNILKNLHAGSLRVGGLVGWWEVMSSNATLNEGMSVEISRWPDQHWWAIAY